MITTHTIEDVKFHGWTLKAGSTVNCYETTYDRETRLSHVSCTSDASEWVLCIPLSAISPVVLDGLERKVV